MSQLDPLNTTIGDLCGAALRECGQFGVGQSPLAEDMNDALARCQWMLQQWERKRFLVYHLVDYAIVSTGAEQYTFGPQGQINTNSTPFYALDVNDPDVASPLALVAGGGGYAVNDTASLVAIPPVGKQNTPVQIIVTSVNGGAITDFAIANAGSIASPLPSGFTVGATSGAGLGATFGAPIWGPPSRAANAAMISARPDKLDSCFLRQIQYSSGNQVDYPLAIMESREDYNRIRLKSLVSFPGAVFMDAGWPLATVFAYPVAQASIYELHLTVKEQLPAKFSSLAQVVNLPFEYYNAIVLNLAWRLKSKYQIPTFPGDPLPGMAKDSLEVLRGANTQIAELTIDPNLTRSGLYNIYSDTDY